MTAPRFSNKRQRRRVGSDKTLDVGGIRRCERMPGGPRSAIVRMRPIDLPVAVLFTVRLRDGMLRGMIRQIAPQFFTTDMRGTLNYYLDKLGFHCVGSWQDPPVYAIVARDEHRIHFRCADAPTPNPEKYDDELLDAYVFVDGVDELYAEYAARGVEFTRPLGDTPWNSREFVVKDCDGRLVAFGSDSE